MIKQTVLIFLLWCTCIGIMDAQAGRCLQFDGFDDYVYIGDVNDLGDCDFTIEAWVYLTGDYQDKIVTKGLTVFGTPANAGYGLRANFAGPNIIDFFVGDSSGQIARTQYEGITLEQWHHVAGVRRAKEIFLYLDGVLVDTDSSDFTYNTDNDIPLTIGALDRGNGNNVDEFMEGRIDEVRIWKRARRAQEINRDKDCAITTPQPHLVAVYNMDAVDGTEVADSSGFDNHGTLVSMPLWVDSEVAPTCMTSATDNPFASQLTISPNPFSSTLQLEGLASSSRISIVDINGRTVENISFDTESTSLNLEQLQSGIYFLKVYTKEGILTRKIIKR